MLGTRGAFVRIGIGKIFWMAVGVAFLATLALSDTASAQQKITYNMSWLPQGSSVGVAVAQDQGWFREAGFDVTLVRGYGGNRTANELDQGQFEIGYVDPISLILNRRNGGNIKLIGAINTRWPATICFIANKHKINGLDDLKGLSLGGGSASPVQQLLPAWLRLNGKQVDFIRLLRMDPAVVDASLIEGKIDLAECWRASNFGLMKKRAKDAGVTLGWLNYSDYKLNAYGSGFAAREDMIQKNPEMLRKFLSAAYRGYELARRNPEQAADILVKMFPAKDRDIALDEIREISELIVDEDVAAKGLGYLREDRMSSTLSFVDQAFDLQGKIKHEDLYTNALLGQ
jgi:NitT/TauT family transport system substrate-binding protein